MSEKTYFSESALKRTFRWPKDYEDIVNILTGEASDKIKCFKTNAHVMVFAAAVALKNKVYETGKLSTGSDTNEIRVSIFEQNKFKSQPLSVYIALMALMHERNADLLRERKDDSDHDGDEKTLEIFTRLALGGLRLIQGFYYDSTNVDALSTLRNEISSSNKS